MSSPTCPRASPCSASWHDRARDRQAGRGAAPRGPRAAAPRPRPDRSGVRAAARRRGAGPRRAHVGGPPQPPVPPRLRRVAVQLPHDAAHRAGDGAAAPRRPQRHRGLLRRRLLVARAPSAPASPSWSACRPAPTSARRRVRPPGWRRAWRSRSRDRSGIEKHRPAHRSEDDRHGHHHSPDVPPAQRSGGLPGLLPRHPRLRGPQRRRVRRDALDHGRPRRPARHVHRAARRRSPTPASPTTSAARSPR